MPVLLLLLIPSQVFGDGVRCKHDTQIDSKALKTPIKHITKDILSRCSPKLATEIVQYVNVFKLAQLESFSTDWLLPVQSGLKGVSIEKTGLRRLNKAAINMTNEDSQLRSISIWYNRQLTELSNGAFTGHFSRLYSISVDHCALEKWDTAKVFGFDIDVHIFY